MRAALGLHYRWYCSFNQSASFGPLWYAMAVVDASIFRLSDGRRLAYLDTPTLPGVPVLFLHGLPSCRIMRPDVALTAQLGARLITFDRPGFGLSDARPGRSLTDTADDIVALIDHLGLDKVASYAESLRQGVDSFAWELQLAARPWGFSLSDIRVPVTVWHGGKDNSIPPVMGKRIEQPSPARNCTCSPTRATYSFCRVGARS
jgi:hypothetical protein